MPAVIPLPVRKPTIGLPSPGGPPPTPTNPLRSRTFQNWRQLVYDTSNSPNISICISTNSEGTPQGDWVSLIFLRLRCINIAQVLYPPALPISDSQELCKVARRNSCAVGDDEVSFGGKESFDTLERCLINVYCTGPHIRTGQLCGASILNKPILIFLGFWRRCRWVSANPAVEDTCARLGGTTGSGISV